MSQKPTAAQQREIRDLANKVFGDDRRLIREWMRRPALALDGARPVDVKKTRDGAAEVARVLEQLHYGVYI